MIYRTFSFLIFFLYLIGCSNNAQIVDKSNNSSKSNKVVNYALNLQGIPYKPGGISPKSGFDCSGFTSYVYANSVRITLPRTSRDQATIGKAVKRNQLQKGDLIFFKFTGSKHISHVGIYIGNNKMIHAPARKGVVRIESLDLPYWQKSYFSARRIL